MGHSCKSMSRLFSLFPEVGLQGRFQKVVLLPVVIHLAIVLVGGYLLSSLNFSVDAATLAAKPSSRRIVVIFEPPAEGYANVAKSLLGSTPIVVVHPSYQDLSGSILRVKKAALSGSEEEFVAAIETLAQVLVDGGFDLEAVANYEEILVISHVPIPIDLIGIPNQPFGSRVGISHVVAPDSTTLEGLLKRLLNPEQFDLTRMALLAVVTLPRGVGRENHDIVKAALKLSNTVPTDIVIEPDAAESLRYLTRKDIQILHIDTHGDQQGMQLGSRDPQLFHVDQLPKEIGPPFLLLVGCSTGAGEGSLASGLVDRGATAVVGMAFAFRSGEPSGGNIKDPVFYETLWDGILQGLPVGQALLRAKQVLPKSSWSSMWLLFGNPHVTFTFTTKQ